MEHLYLMLERLSDGFSPILAFCVAGDEVVSAAPIERRFASNRQLETALRHAGLNLDEVWRELTAINGGFPTFIRISEEQALALELLHKAA